MSRLSGTGEGATTAADLACVGPLGATDVQTALNAIALSASLPAPGSSGNLLTSNGAAWVSAAPATPNVSSVTGTLALANGGTGQTTALAAFAALAPAPGAAGRVLVSDGTVNWTAIALAIADTTGVLALGRGGTGANSQAGAANAILPAQSANFVLRSDGANVSWALVNLAVNVSGTLPFGSGGTGLTAVGSAGNVLRSTGSAWASAALGVADVVGAAPLNGPNFTGTVVVGAFTATGGAVSLSGATSVTVPNVTPATTSSTAAANTAFVQSAIASAEDPFRRQVQIDKFTAGLFAGSLGWIGTVNGGGAIATANSAVVTGSDGHRTLNPGASATGRSAMSFESIAGQLPYVTPWSRGKAVFEWRVQVSSIADDFELSVSLGAGAATNSTSLVSGFGAVYTTATAQWTLVSRSAGVTVATQASGVALAANTWVYIRIELEGASARLYVGATKAAAGTTPVATITTVGASVLALGPMAKITNIGGVNSARNFVVGLFASDFTLTTPV